MTRYRVFPDPRRARLPKSVDDGLDAC
ncbi:MAG: hypothetical protein RLZZ180_478, partial [Pseudomonadota bacterium]